MEWVKLRRLACYYNIVSLTLATSKAPNLAPAVDLTAPIARQAQDKTVEVEPDWFKDQKRELEQEDKQTWDNETLKWALVFNFIEGRHLLKRARYGFGWRSVPMPNQTDIPVYGFNLTGFYSENIKAKWTQSNTDIRWRPARDTDDAIGASKAAQVVHDHYKRKLYTQTFKQTESMLAQCGKYARYYYYTDEVKSYARRPKVESVPMQFGEGSYFCPDCGSAGSAGELSATGMEAMDIPGARPMGAGAIPTEADQGEVRYGGGAVEAGSGSDGGMAGFPNDADPGQEQPAATCPQCGSPNLEIEQAEPLESETVTGYEEIEHGDIVCEDVPAFELKHDLSQLPQDSPYLIRRRRVRLPLLQAKFPFIHITQSKGDDRGLRIQDSLKRASASGNTAFSKDSNDEPATDFIQVWLDPCMYARLTLKTEMRTLNGMTIPAGTPLTELFPDGIYMCFVEGIDGVVELRNEHHKEFWVGQVYRQRAVSSLGIGIEDIVEGNRQYNLIMSIIYTQLRTSAMPATLFDERLLPNGVSSYLGSLSNIPVNLAALEDTRRLQDSVYQLMPQPPTSQHFGYADKLNNYMQLASRVTDFSGGLPGVNNKTATGAELTSANAQSLFAPQLALKAEVDKCGAEIVLRLFKKYCIDEIYITLEGRRGEMDGKWLKAADIGVDMFAEVVPDSYLPQTNLERRERWDAFLGRVGGLPGLKMALQEFPEQVEQLAEIFDVDLASADYTAAAETERERIEQMRAALPMLQVMMGQMPPTQMAADPMTGQMTEVPVDPMAEVGQFLLGILNPPIEIEEMGHLAAIAFDRAFLTTDEGKEAPPELRAGVKAMIPVHIEGLIAEGQITGMIGMAGQPAPMMPAGEENGKSRNNPNPDEKQMRPSQEAKAQRKEQEQVV